MIAAAGAKCGRGTSAISANAIDAASAASPAPVQRIGTSGFGGSTASTTTDVAPLVVSAIPPSAAHPTTTTAIIARSCASDDWIPANETAPAPTANPPDSTTRTRTGISPGDRKEGSTYRPMTPTVGPSRDASTAATSTTADETAITPIAATANARCA